MKKNNFVAFLVLGGLLSLAAQCNKNGNPAPAPPVTPNPPVKNDMAVWITQADQSVLLKPAQGSFVFGTPVNGFATVEVDDSRSFQEIDGFGFTLTGGSATLIHKMDAAPRAALLKELFGTQPDDIGVSYLRLSIGASDLDPVVFSYNDLPDGQTDINQEKFSIEAEKKDLIPVLKSILSINPHIKIMAAPWSPPLWMKDNKSSIGGSLLPQYYASYALYFVKYIQAMQAQGISIDAITVQNEPLHPGNNPSLLMLAEQQLDFIKNHLGPAFQNAAIKTKIVLFDHNLNRTDYPLTILKDAAARAFIDGTAFHLYEGDIGAMAAVHDAYPDKNLYFTEQWTGSKGSFDGDYQWHIKNVIIGSMRNWSKIALEWNLANDPTFGPHTPGGCTECKGALTIEGSGVFRNVAYYIIAQASKFIPAGSKRIFTDIIKEVSQVAFITPEGKKVLIALNEAAIPVTINVKYKNRWVPVKIPAKAGATLVW